MARQPLSLHLFGISSLDGTQSRQQGPAAQPAPLCLLEQQQAAPAQTTAGQHNPCDPSNHNLEERGSRPEPPPWS
jgi:hypothetical protein